MIFASLGLLIAAGGFLAGGIINSNVGLLVASLVCTAVAGVVLLVAYSSARNAAASTGGALPVALPGGAPAAVAGAQPVLMYVPVSQVPGALQPVGVGNGGTAPAPASAPAAAAFAAASPFLGYDDMTADQIVKLVASGALTEEQLLAVRDYEARGQARKTVLDKLDRAIG